MPRPPAAQKSGQFCHPLLVAHPEHMPVTASVQGDSCCGPIWPCQLCHIRGRHSTGDDVHTSADQIVDTRAGELGSRAFQPLCYPSSSRSQDLWRGQRAFRQVGILLLRVRALTVFMFTSHRVSADADVEAQRKGAARLGTRSRRGGAGSLGQDPGYYSWCLCHAPRLLPRSTRVALLPIK